MNVFHCHGNGKIGSTLFYIWKVQVVSHRWKYLDDNTFATGLYNRYSNVVQILYLKLFPTFSEYVSTPDAMGLRLPTHT